VNSLKIPLYRSQTAILSAILRAVSNADYRWYTIHHIPLEKLPSVLERIDQKHHVFLSPSYRAAIKSAGHPVAQLFLAPTPKPDLTGNPRWTFILLATQKLKAEQMFDLEKTPLVWDEKYQLEQALDDRWTWKLEQGFFQKIASSIQGHCILRDHKALSFQLKRVAELPMFSGVRRDAKSLLLLAERGWGKRHAALSGVKTGRVQWIERLLYLRGAAVKLYRHEYPLTLGDWLEQARAGEMPSSLADEA
jgi:hypothetical protein